ncbi:uncharacterized protein LOC115794227 [Archocentrus centrarchus]|uniref:uncharacterized protein LOC115794227 n=1 Tax=Archocentrus centrarchus TaxID=63155 RepID=UPI0011EA1E2D|nr:uncharacterized protein LOC115794227 [Archocentrus centrarchus]
MAVCDKKILWSFTMLLAVAVGQTVIYSFTSTCAVKRSTLTLPCSFTPLKSFNKGGREVPLKIVRVRWCQKHELCQGDTSSVYDSKSTKKDSNYQYLGDMKTNCTLQIRDIQQRNKGTFRFRMEADNAAGHFTNRTGVTVRVVDGTKMRIISSSEDKKLRGNETITLLCTSVCTFHQLEVTWFRDGHALSETGPSLHLSTLTAEDSGNYTCALKANNKTLSEPHNLQVESGDQGGVQIKVRRAILPHRCRPACGSPINALFQGRHLASQSHRLSLNEPHAADPWVRLIGHSKLPTGVCVNGCLSLSVSPATGWQPAQGVPASRRGDNNLALVAGVVFVVLLAVIMLILFLFIIKRKLAAAAEDQRAVGGEMEQKHPENIYSCVQEEAHNQEASRAVEDVSYAAVQFQQRRQRGRHVEEVEDAVIYSSVAK